jgi:hypothetical protein
MVLGYPIKGFLFGWLVIIFATAILSLLPFVIRRFRPEAYRGIWKVSGDLLKSPKRALGYPLGALIGVLLVILLFYDREVSIDRLQTLWLTSLSLFIIFIAIVLGIRWYLDDKSK